MGRWFREKKSPRLREGAGGEWGISNKVGIS